MTDALITRSCKVIAPTAVFDSYWKLATERQNILFKRLAGEPRPWTADEVIAKHRFTNAYRAADRVSQFLIGVLRDVSDVREALFKTLLFRLFNKIETWEAICTALGREPSWETFSSAELELALHDAKSAGETLYSAAYMMPSPRLGESTKHADHVKLVHYALLSDLPDRIAAATSLRDVYEALLTLPSFGPFLAMQAAIDLNYSDAVDFDEDSFIVAGPGALDGISKCFTPESLAGVSPEEVILAVTLAQDAELKARGLQFKTLFGRKLKLIDCQNLFCEISKYARVAHPDVAGAAGRTKIKQKFCGDRAALPAFVAPKKWGLDAAISAFYASL